ncbi:MAG TPA: aminopeptidase [Candidatus Bathyarchaeia archaeon]|nr:aminopeptidase [Candidatus Bathyarchaeia archaeon]
MVNFEDVASNVIEVSLDLKRGERVWIHGWDHTIELVSQLAWKCKDLGCDVMLTIQPEDFWMRCIMEAPLKSIERVPIHQAAALRETDVYIFTLGPRSPIPWERIPKERCKAVSVYLDRRYDRTKFAEEWAEIVIKRKVRMLAIEATFATPERAKALGLNYEELKDVMFAGCTADYREVKRRGKGLASLLSGKERVHLTTPGGTDIRFTLDQRPVEIGDGLATEEKAEKGIVTFLPAGGVEVSAYESSAEGTIVYDVPVRVEGGPIVGLTLQVRDGRVVEFTARKGREIFERYLKQGKGDVDRFAFIDFGLNPHLRHGYTQDDKVLGGVTVGFGDNESKGGKNRADGQDWWASMTKSTVSIGDTLIMRDGVLLI